MSDFGCENAAAIAAAPNVFTSMGDMARKRCDWRPHEGYPAGLLGPSCHLFARKCAPGSCRLSPCAPFPCLHA
jgi:hypothetical protein